MSPERKDDLVRQVHKAMTQTRGTSDHEQAAVYLVADAVLALLLEVVPEVAP